MKIENKDYKKFYEEALERAKIKHDEYMRLDGPESYVPQDIEYIFPELAESEDEKIRKWIINEIKIKHHNLDEDNVDFVDKAIAWLEKQGTPAKLSEEDDKVFKAIYEDLHMYYTVKANMLGYDTYKKEYEKKWEDAKKWLEEHKEHWKPTEEQ